VLRTRMDPQAMTVKGSNFGVTGELKNQGTGGWRGKIKLSFVDPGSRITTVSRALSPKRKIRRPSPQGHEIGKEKTRGRFCSTSLQETWGKETRTLAMVREIILFEESFLTGRSREEALSRLRGEKTKVGIPRTR